MLWKRQAAIRHGQSLPPVRRRSAHPRVL